MRSMRARISSAVSPSSTANGSIGVCRKRDFFFMRRQLYRLKRSTDPEVDRRAIARDAAAVVTARGADRRGERKEVSGDDVRRQLAADRCLERVGAERARPD